MLNPTMIDPLKDILEQVKINDAVCGIPLQVPTLAEVFGANLADTLKKLDQVGEQHGLEQVVLDAREIARDALPVFIAGNCGTSVKFAETWVDRVLNAIGTLVAESHKTDAKAILETSIQYLYSEVCYNIFAINMEEYVAYLRAIFPTEQVMYFSEDQLEARYANPGQKYTAENVKDLHVQSSTAFTILYAMRTMELITLAPLPDTRAMMLPGSYQTLKRMLIEDAVPAPETTETQSPITLQKNLKGTSV